MTAMTNAPPLPDLSALAFEICNYDGFDDTRARAERVLKRELTTLRAQLEQSPMRESAIGLERQLAEARGELERGRNRVTDINDCLQTILGDGIFGMERERIEEIQDERAAETARADACEKDAKRYRWLREHINYTDEIRSTSPVHQATDALTWRVRCWKHDSNDFTSNTLDAAIDAALSGAPT